MPAILIAVDGSETKLPNAGLKTLQKAVGGYIELTYTNRGEEMYINEDGKGLCLPVNKKATLLYQHNLRDEIVGNVVVIRKGVDK